MLFVITEFGGFCCGEVHKVIGGSVRACALVRCSGGFRY